MPPPHRHRPEHLLRHTHDGVSVTWNVHVIEERRVLLCSVGAARFSEASGRTGCCGENCLLMDPREAQLVQAVDIASNPAAVPDADLVAQALAYLEQLKQSTDESWSIGWAVWTARDDSDERPKYGQAARMFGLNLVDDFLDSRYVSPAPPELTGAVFSRLRTPMRRSHTCKRQHSPMFRVTSWRGVVRMGSHTSRTRLRRRYRC